MSKPLTPGYVYFIAVSAMVMTVLLWSWVTARMNFHDRKQLYQECLSVHKQTSERNQKNLFLTCTPP